MLYSKLFEIISGWKNYFCENPVSERIAKKRSKICSECNSIEKGGWIVKQIGDDIEEIQGYVCGECGCPLSSLLRAKSSECKLKKWKAVIY